MSKYLRDLYLYGPDPVYPISKAGEEAFHVTNGHLWSSCKLIVDLYNYNWPAKYVAPDNEWRFFIGITTNPHLDHTKEYNKKYFYLDLEVLKPLSVTARKEYLFHAIADFMVHHCKQIGYSHTEFEALNQLIMDKGIRFDEQHKKEKASADRKHKAFIWRKYDEFESATYIKVVDKAGHTVLFKKIGDFHFSHFDRLAWQDNETILVFANNTYKGLKEAEDHYKISLNGTITYVPQTREGICYYGIELMRDPATFDTGLEYIQKADQIGHGKARNILENLELTPDERNVDTLLQAPGKQKKRSHKL